MQVMKQCDYKRMPWKNGLGETLEIHRLDDADGVRFRISQAAVVEDGVFSDFSGLHRTLVLLSGNDMTLHHQSQLDSVLKKPLDIARFAGDDETLATLHNGAIEDLNIMVRDTDTKAAVTACLSPHIIETSTDQTVLFEGFYANQKCTFSIKTERETLTVEPHSFMKFETNTTTKLVAGSGVFIQILER
ncbi:HutD-family protein [Marinomonas ushuaiensis DSM 15871]|uniref:HutD-family protein n=1 Tax=Marinomonas ushuaiensis DSM 15871 TaxID=1122207 RepID=X7EBQ3_9GAMM|nr:HutD-family protein [Marinomonas ushuaiensis DSM 15871]